LPEEAMNSSPWREITFRLVEERDFPLLAAWLAEPHVPQVLSENVRLVGGRRVGVRRVRSRGRTEHCHLAIGAGKPFAYLQFYRNADYRERADLIGVDGGISVDLFIGDSTYLRKGFGGLR
jgi:aminoglycoside 6'-N-acetyltransferase